MDEPTELEKSFIKSSFSHKHMLSASRERLLLAQETFLRFESLLSGFQHTLAKPNVRKIIHIIEEELKQHENLKPGRNQNQTHRETNPDGTEPMGASAL